MKMTFLFLKCRKSKTFKIMEWLTEKVDIGNARFSLLIKEGFYQAPGVEIPRLHCHPDFELHCIIKGTYLLQLENSVKEIKAPALLLFPPRVYHELKAKSKENTRYCFEFALSSIGNGNSYSEYYRILAHITTWKYYPIGVSDVREVQKKPGTREEKSFYLSTALGEILLTLFDELKKDAPKKKKVAPKRASNTMERNKILTRIIKFIEINFLCQLTLQDVEQEFSISGRQIERLLRENLNMGFLSLLNRYRVRLSVLRILEGNETLREISEECGFPNYATFWKHFKNYNGMSPSEFLKKQRTKKTSHKEL